jgi:hypothetical protein
MIKITGSCDFYHLLSVFFTVGVTHFWAFPYGSGYTLQCQLALRDGVGISAAIPNATAGPMR